MVLSRDQQLAKVVSLRADADALEHSGASVRRVAFLRRMASAMETRARCTELDMDSAVVAMRDAFARFSGKVAR